MKTLKLGKREYQVNKLPFKKAKEWREKHGKILEDGVASLGSTKEIFKTDDLSKVPISDLLEFVFNNMETLSTIFLKSPDLAFEALCDFSPEIARDREALENEAYDDELLKAFMEVLLLAFPLLGNLLGSLNLGSLTQTTSKSSPDQKAGEETSTK